MSVRVQNPLPAAAFITDFSQSLRIQTRILGGNEIAKTVVEGARTVRKEKAV
jgi:hypothetical protein